jgi:antitoxin PrlF
MELARITSKGQMTIPKRIRDAAGLKEGDVVSVDTEGDRVLLCKVAAKDDAYLQAVQGTLEEWTSPEDEDAWRSL